MLAIGERLGIVWRREGRGMSVRHELRDLTPEQIDALIESTARTLLQVSSDEAMRLLDAGDLDGTVAGESLRSLRWLKAA